MQRLTFSQTLFQTICVLHARFQRLLYIFFVFVPSLNSTGLLFCLYFLFFILICLLLVLCLSFLNGYFNYGTFIYVYFIIFHGPLFLPIHVSFFNFFKIDTYSHLHHLTSPLHQFLTFQLLFSCFQILTPFYPLLLLVPPFICLSLSNGLPQHFPFPKLYNDGSCFPQKDSCGIGGGISKS